MSFVRFCEFIVAEQNMEGNSLENTSLSLSTDEDQLMAFSLCLLLVNNTTTY